MPRNKLDIIKSKALSNLIFLIAKGIDYPQAITKEIGNLKGKKLDAGAITIQLRKLREEGFIYSKKEHFHNDKTKKVKRAHCVINWERIFLEFLNFLKEKKDAYLENPQSEKFANSELKILQKLDNPKSRMDFAKILSQDRITKDLFEHILGRHVGKEKSLQNLFESFSSGGFLNGLKAAYGWLNIKFHEDIREGGDVFFQTKIKAEKKYYKKNGRGKSYIDTEALIRDILSQKITKNLDTLKDIIDVLAEDTLLEKSILEYFIKNHEDLEEEIAMHAIVS